MTLLGTPCTHLYHIASHSTFSLHVYLLISGVYGELLDTGTVPSTSALLALGTAPGTWQIFKIYLCNEPGFKPGPFDVKLELLPFGYHSVRICL